MKSMFFKANLKRSFNTATQEALSQSSTLTRVRIWKSGYFTDDGDFKFTSVGHALLKSISPSRVGNIGHVSLETKDFYASLWPEQLTILNKHKMQDAITSNIEADLASEGRPPDHLIDLQTLDLEEMLIRLRQFEEHNKYHLVGGNKVFNSHSAANCSSLAHSLLLAGGIRKFIPPTLSVRDTLIVTPNNLADMVVQAKDKENEQLTTERNESPTNKP